MSRRPHRLDLLHHAVHAGSPLIPSSPPIPDPPPPRLRSSALAVPTSCRSSALGSWKTDLLAELYIDSSGVTGPIPEELSNLKSLQTFWASDNPFTGKLPEFLGILTELIDLRLEGTLLEGPIPSNFGALTKLDILRIGDLSKEDSIWKI